MEPIDLSSIDIGSKDAERRENVLIYHRILYIMIGWIVYSIWLGGRNSFKYF